MKKALLIACMLVGIAGSASAQRDDLYFIPKKKKAAVSEKADVGAVNRADEQAVQSDANTSSATAVPAKGLMIDEDAYNRRGAYLTEEGDAVSAFAMDDEGFVVITEEGDTLWMDTDTLRLTRAQDDEGWVNGFEGSDSDYEYAMRIVRFRNPRYAIPVSSPLYWDVVYGGALWPSWEWNIYNDGMYAYVFPTSSNWYYWDYMMSYPFGWSAWNHHWPYHYGCHWGGGHYGFYGHVWYDPWYNPYFHGYHPGWHHGHHHGFYPGAHAGKPGWGGPKAFPNHRTSAAASTRRGTQHGETAGRSASSNASRTGVAVGATRRADNGTSRNSSVRVVTGRTGTTSQSVGTLRSSGSSRTGSDEVIRRGTGSSSVSRGTATGSTSRSSYTRQSTSRSSSSGSSYNRPSSTRSSSSSSSVSRSSSSSSRAGSYSGSSSSSTRSSSYSSGSSRSSSYSSGGSYGGGSRSGGGSYSGSSSRSSGSRR